MQNQRAGRIISTHMEYMEEESSIVKCDSHLNSVGEELISENVENESFLDKLHLRIYVTKSPLS